MRWALLMAVAFVFAVSASHGVPMAEAEDRCDLFPDDEGCGSGYVPPPDPPDPPDPPVCQGSCGGSPGLDVGYCNDPSFDFPPYQDYCTWAS